MLNKKHLIIQRVERDEMFSKYMSGEKTGYHGWEISGVIPKIQN